ncbi:MAG: AAA family ATPase [Acetobacteraceae bacterium]
MFRLLLESVREPESGGESEKLAADLAAALVNPGDPTGILPCRAGVLSDAPPWRLAKLEAEGFGGLNTWRGAPFVFDFDEQSWLLDGPNGSGKSSLVGAVVWALTGERPRDHSADHAPHDARPVFGVDDRNAGQWPPVACYPPDEAALALAPRTRVRLTFRSPSGATAVAERVLNESGLVEHRDESLVIPSIFIETGLLMPIRLGQLRLSGGESGLAQAVRTLTGLDELVAVADLATGLADGRGRYLGYARAKGRELKAAQFDRALQTAREALAQVELHVPAFVPTDADSPGPLATLQESVAAGAEAALATIRDELAPGLELGKAAVQQELAASIGRAKEALASGLARLQTWRMLSTVVAGLNQAAEKRVVAAIADARRSLLEVADLHRRSLSDSRFRLKAVAAAWHAQHGSGPIERCPLCSQSLGAVPELTAELEKLREASTAAQRVLADNVRAIAQAVDDSIPAAVKPYLSSIRALAPRQSMVDELRAEFVDAATYRRHLAGLGIVVEAALARTPGAEFESAIPTEDGGLPRETRPILERISAAERLLAIARWGRDQQPCWERWWADVFANRASAQSFATRLERVIAAAARAAPFQVAAGSLSEARLIGPEVAEIDREQLRRQRVAEAVGTLRRLKGFADGEARTAIARLSERIGELLDAFYISDQLRFRQARLERRSGVSIRSGFTSSLQFDATLVANSSWLRATLWAFLFALREDAIAQYGGDPFPVLAFDDPQATFDFHNRHRWAQYVAGLQHAPVPVQVILASHDEPFLAQLGTGGVSGRNAIVAAAGTDFPHIQVIEGSILARLWETAEKEKTPRCAQDFIIGVRKQTESMLRLMLRGEDAGVPNFILRQLRDLLERLQSRAVPPWRLPCFAELIGLLNNGRPEIKFMQQSAHPDAHLLGIAEAVDVERHYRTKLWPELERCFRTVRDYRALYGETVPFRAAPSTVGFPDGYREAVREARLSLVGRAAALSNGRPGDGMVAIDTSVDPGLSVTLRNHSAYRLTASTLEPVAQAGDVLLVQEHGEPTARSLVVAIVADKLLARRLEFPEESPDTAVLTALAIDPMAVASPILAHRSTISMKKIVGVIYDRVGRGAVVPGSNEVADCGGTSAFRRAMSVTQGLIEVVGVSAVPLVLSGQFLLVGRPVPFERDLPPLDGWPVIGGDSEGQQYVKRLRVLRSAVVLESLDAAGRHPPLLFARPGRPGLRVQTVSPVVGVLFEHSM